MAGTNATFEKHALIFSFSNAGAKLSAVEKRKWVVKTIQEQENIKTDVDKFSLLGLGRTMMMVVFKDATQATHLLEKCESLNRNGSVCTLSRWKSETAQRAEISPAASYKQRLMREQFWAQFDNIPAKGHPLIKDHLEVEYPANKVLKQQTAAALSTPEDYDNILGIAKQTIEGQSPQADPSLKRQASPQKTNDNEPSGKKKRKGSTPVEGSEPTEDLNPQAHLTGRDQADQDLIQQGMVISPTKKEDAGISRGKGDSPIPWLQEYLERAKNEREKGFDIRVACMKHQEKTGRNNTSTIAGIHTTKNSYNILRLQSELSGFGAFRYHEKKREREASGSETESSAETQSHKDPIRDMVPKKWKPSKGRDKMPRKSQADPFEKGSAQRSIKREIVIVAAQTKCLFDRNEEYRQKHSKEYCTIRNVAENRTPHVTEKAASDRKTIKTVRPLVPVQYRRKFGEWQVATNVLFTVPTLGDQRNLARAIKEGISDEFSAGVYKVPVALAEHADETGQAPDTAKSFEPILVKLDERARLHEGLVWSHILITEHSLRDEATALHVEPDDDKGSMVDDEDYGMAIGISLEGAGTGTTPLPEGNVGAYSLSSVPGKENSEDSENSDDSKLGSSETSAAVD
ncbi:hypothetical protein CBR_g45641 [Chara braunii]|uniref:Uncharacterized protein n=1 Tax=Chara braunii TaxID=69332 RepID=A0A388K3E2_CHABU|nr:hypothetical protein CBR_g45641 [Chara braunii]|eukprot:GBG64584.1 hypothetical protein CBR_g45641 [Chara braunii]